MHSKIVCVCVRVRVCGELWQHSSNVEHGFRAAAVVKALMSDFQYLQLPAGLLHNHAKQSQPSIYPHHPLYAKPLKGLLSLHDTKYFRHETDIPILITVLDGLVYYLASQ